MLEKLLNNASKFTPQGGAIRVEVRDHADAVEIRVADEGIGIEPAKTPTVQGARYPQTCSGAGPAPRRSDGDHAVRAARAAISYDFIRAWWSKICDVIMSSSAPVRSMNACSA